MKTYFNLSGLFALLLLLMSACNTLAFKDKQLTATEARKLVKKNSNIVIIDVRTPEEFSQGHLKDAVNIDFKAPDFNSKISTLDKDKTYLLYCRSGNRSGKALAIMTEQNFKAVYNSAAGFDELKNSGLPTE